MYTLHHDEVGLVVERQLLDVLVLELDLVVRVEVAGERGQPERREERVLDRPETRAVRLEQRRQDERHVHGGLLGGVEPAAGGAETRVVRPRPRHSPV